MFPCHQTNAPADIFLVPLETLSQGQPIGTRYTSVGTLVWPQESKNTAAVFRVKYTVGGGCLAKVDVRFTHPCFEIPKS